MNGSKARHWERVLLRGAPEGACELPTSSARCLRSPPTLNNRDVYPCAIRFLLMVWQIPQSGHLEHALRKRPRRDSFSPGAQLGVS